MMLRAARIKGLPVLAVALVAAMLPAQHGLYRGFADMVAMPDRRGPSANAGPPARPRDDAADAADERYLADWSLWWEFEKLSWLRRAAGPGVPADRVQTEIVPALAHALAHSDDRRITAACMVALARIGRAPDGVDLTTMLTGQLRSPDPDVQLTAALALGIAAADEKALEALAAQVRYDGYLRAAARDRSVAPAMRPYALYAIGLFAQRHPDAATQRRVAALLGSLRAAAAGGEGGDVARIDALGMLRLRRDTTADGQALDAAADDLLVFVDHGDDEGFATDLNAAHAMTALARLLGRDDARSDEVARRCAAELAPDRQRPHRSRAAALALGAVGRSDDDARRDVLLAAAQRHPDLQTRAFARIGLARLGGTASRDRLLELLRGDGGAQGDRLLQQWTALALGVWTASARGDDAAIARRALRDVFAAATDRSTIGAAAIALGLAHHTDTAPQLLARLAADEHADHCTGYLCTALALLGERDAVPFAVAALRRDDSLEGACVHAPLAIGMLGAGGVPEQLVTTLARSEPQHARLASLAAGIGLTHDHHAVAPLLALLLDEHELHETRAYAAAALGWLADPAPLPWHEALTRAIDHRATLPMHVTGRHDGLLERL